MIHVSRFKLTVLAVASVLSTALPAAASSVNTAGTLQLHLATLDNKWHQVDCPTATPSPTALCEAMQGQGIVPGLGRTIEAYTYVVDDLSAASTSVHFVGTLTVAGKGEIGVSAATPTPVCGCGADDSTLDFTITGGTGTYAGAQGSGTVIAAQRSTGPSQGWGIDTWSGTLTVPGYTFDTAKPVISGSVPRTIKARRGAKRVRVTFNVSARDPDEGTLAATCTPHSGSYFKLGRTNVRCSATDTNGNSAHASFTITVKQ